MEDVKIPVKILMMKLISNLNPSMCKQLRIREEDRAVGLLSTDCDDATYVALDAATKSSNVYVAYARSLYAGATNASTGFAGEVIGVLAGPTPSEVLSGLDAAKTVLESDVCFRKCGESAFFAQCISRTGSYLSNLAHIQQGEALAYLVGPPVEAVVGLDAAMKAADVELALMFDPPTETNFAGGLLHGSQSACLAACEAFADSVKRCAAHPMEIGR